MNIIGESVLEAFRLQSTLEYTTDLGPDLMLYVADQTKYPNEQSSKLLKILLVFCNSL